MGQDLHAEGTARFRPHTLEHQLDTEKATVQIFKHAFAELMECILTHAPEPSGSDPCRNMQVCVASQGLMFV